MDLLPDIDVSLNQSDQLPLDRVPGGENDDQIPSVAVGHARSITDLIFDGIDPLAYPSMEPSGRVR